MPANDMPVQARERPLQVPAYWSGREALPHPGAGMRSHFDSESELTGGKYAGALR
jgi:hypothetical protein